MGDFEKVVNVKNRSHRSWINLWNAARKELNLSFLFGTDKVEASSKSYLKTAMRESNLTAMEILEEIESRSLI